MNTCLTKSLKTGAALLASGLLIALLSSCSGSGSDSNTNAATTGNTAPAAAQQGTAPAQATAQASQTVGNLPKSGKVIKAMHAGGYTYMELEDAGKHFWIAATMLNVKRNERVTWADAAVMKNFKSSSLRRTFDEILFVSAAEVMK